jgi:hypothetical protein
MQHPNSGDDMDPKLKLADRLALVAARAGEGKVTHAVAGLGSLVILGLSVLAIVAFDAVAGIALEASPIVIVGVVTVAAAILLGPASTSSARERSA